MAGRAKAAPDGCTHLLPPPEGPKAGAIHRPSRRKKVAPISFPCTSVAQLHSLIPSVDDNRVSGVLAWNRNNRLVLMPPRIQRFGGPHTQLKEEVVLRYLEAYLVALSAQPFNLTYIDAFAGSGWRRSTGSPGGAGTRGCALKVLAMPRRFHRYSFGDLKPQNVASLNQEVEQQREAWSAAGLALPQQPEVSVACADANDLVADECARLRANRMARAVAFLDPFGMQVKWETLRRIKETGKVDLWLLLPIHIGLVRMLPRHGRMHEAWKRRLDEFLGYTGWREQAYPETTTVDLFGERTVTQRVEADQLTNIVMARLRELFGTGLLNRALDLHIGGRRSYTLVFACTSPVSGAVRVAHNIAGHIIGKSQAT